MVELSLEQKIADFHRARAQIRAPIEKAAWKRHQFEMSQKYDERYMPKEEAIELYERILTILEHAPSQIGAIDSLLASSDYSQATAKLAWIENNTFAGSNGSMIRRKDAHTKFAPNWANGKLVHRQPTLYMRSIEDMYTALSDIAEQKTKPVQYQFTRATAPFSPIFNDATKAIKSDAVNARAFYENNFGEGSKEYRAGLFAQLSEVAKSNTMAWAPRPYSVAFALVEQLRIQFGVEQAQDEVNALAPFLLYGTQMPQTTTTNTHREGNTTRRFIHDGSRVTTPVKQTSAPKYTPPKMTFVTDRPTVQISYSPIMGGNGAF